MTPRIIYMGSPDFALPSLEALARSYEIVAVVTQPDRPAGRGRKPQACAVKELATRLGLTVLQPGIPANPWRGNGIGNQPDLIVVAAYGRICQKPSLRNAKIWMCQRPCFAFARLAGRFANSGCHSQWRQPDGVTIMLMDEGMDTGPHPGATLCSDQERTSAGAF